MNGAIKKKEEKRKKKIADAEESEETAQDSGEDQKSEEVYKAEEAPAVESRIPRVKLHGLWRRLRGCEEAAEETDEESSQEESAGSGQEDSVGAGGYYVGVRMCYG